MRVFNKGKQKYYTKIIHLLLLTNMKNKKTKLISAFAVILLTLIMLLPGTTNAQDVTFSTLQRYNFVISR